MLNQDMVSVEPHSKIGKRKDSSIPEEQLEVKDSTKSRIWKTYLHNKVKNFKKEFKKARLSYMQGCPVQDNEMTFKDKLTDSLKHTPKPSSSKTSDQGSTSKDKGFKPFWTPSCAEMSQKLWCPTKIDCVDSVMSYSNRSVEEGISKSGFSMCQTINKQVEMKLSKTSLPSSTSMLPEKMVSEPVATGVKGSKKTKKKVGLQKNRPADQKKKEIGKVKTVKIYFHPNSKQKKLLNEYFTAVNKIYNGCLDNEDLLKEYDEELHRYKQAKEAKKKAKENKDKDVEATKSTKPVKSRKGKKVIVETQPLESNEATESNQSTPIEETKPVKTMKQIDELAKKFILQIRAQYLRAESKFYPSIGYDVKEYAMESFLSARSKCKNDLKVRRKETDIYRASFKLHNSFVSFDYGNNYFTFNTDLLNKRLRSGDIDSIYFKCTPSVDISFIDLDHECSVVKNGSKYFLAVLVDADTYYKKRKNPRTELSKDIVNARMEYKQRIAPVAEQLLETKRIIKKTKADKNEEDKKGKDKVDEDDKSDEVDKVDLDKITHEADVIDQRLKQITAEYKLTKNNLLSEHINDRKQDKELPNDQKLLFISIDPGIRKFITGYDPEKAIMIGKCEDIRRLNEYKDKIRAYQSALAGEDNIKLPNRICKKLKGKILRLHERITNKINNFHYHVANYLCINYKNILIPKFGSKELYSKAIRRIGKKTVKDMSTWAHCSFREILKHKADQYQNVNVIEVPEDYTTKTCSGCGWLNQTIGASEIFQCKGSCGNTFDRDINASKNIFLKNKQFLSL